MKLRLVTFGCSFTYGDSLNNPNRESWPVLLSKMIGKKSVNKAIPGASNLEILNSILSFKFRATDSVIIGWTYCNRDIIFNGILPNTKIGPWLDQEIFENWVKVHTAYDSRVRSGIYIHHANSYLKSLGIKTLNTWAPPVILLNYFTDSFSKDRNLPKLIGNIKLHKGILNMDDYANDNQHPGPISHRNAAEKFLKILNEQ